MFENCLGPTALKMYNQLDFTGMTNDIATILKQMEHAIIGDLNETYERYVFNSRDQHEDETIDTFVTELRTLAKSCGFCDCVVKGSLHISDCTTNLTASRHVVVHVHPTANPHTTSTHDSTRLLHWSSCPHFLMVASTTILYPEPWASLSTLSESTILARDTPVALDSPSMRERLLVEYPSAPHTHTAHARVSLLWLIPSIGASLAWHHILPCFLLRQWSLCWAGAHTRKRWA